MKKNMLLPAVLLLFTLQIKAQNLRGTKWNLKAMYDETNQNVLVDPGMKGTLFFKTDSTYEGSFCNSYFGKYTLGKKESLLMKKPMATRKYCNGGYSELETKLFEYYGTTNVYIQEAGELSLISDKGKLVFIKQE